MRNKSRALTAGILALLVAGSVSTAWAAGFDTVVKTKQGKVEGRIDAVHDVAEWYGVPYMAAPVKELRWRAPQKAPKWEGVRKADQPAPAFIQGNAKKVTGTESAVTLDIYRPNTEEKNLPVFVFLHGGNNQVGHSRTLKGELFAKETNAIYVSAQYRMGALGFNNLPALATGNAREDSGNYTLLDQAEALTWVKKNIKKFGGDAKNVTVSGFSAGGRDVMAMLISPEFKGKFEKAVSFSGGLTTTPPEDGRRVIARALAQLVVADNVKANTKEAAAWLQSKDPKVKEYLYSLPAERIVPLMGAAAIRMSVFPHLFADGHVLPKEGFATKHFNNVPVIMLAGSGEFNSFSGRDKYFASSIKDGSIMSDKKKAAAFAFANNYGGQLYGFFNGQESALTIADHYKAPIYVCKVAWGSNAAVVGEKFATITNATHGIFVPFITDQADNGLRRSYPEAFAQKGMQELSHDMLSYFSNFMRTGNPNGARLPQWSRWTKKNRLELVMDATTEASNCYEAQDSTDYALILKDIENDQSIPAAEKHKIIAEVLNGRWFSAGLDQHFGNKDLWK